MRTLAVISRKGGVGKTTLSVNLAVAAWRAGLKTVLVDLDPQRSASLWGRIRSHSGPAVVTASAGKLFTAWSAASNSGCDLMVIDTPAADGDETLQAARLADLSLLVCRPNRFDLDALQHSIDLVRRQAKTSLVVLNQAPSRRMGQEPQSVFAAADELRAAGVSLAGTGLRHRAAFPAAAARGLGVEEFEPSSAGAREVAGVWSQVWDLLQTAPGAAALRSVPKPVAVQVAESRA